mmetsp:Transcript_5298/g.7140  ORF Transcript_5298/g.7140 Transcript_5298/m.7140 type:complete len:118 (-) Transcript_5298:1348-1701(-)
MEYYRLWSRYDEKQEQKYQHDNLYKLQWRELLYRIHQKGWLSKDRHVGVRKDVVYVLIISTMVFFHDDVVTHILQLHHHSFNVTIITLNFLNMSNIIFSSFLLHIDTFNLIFSLSFS